MEEFTVNDYLKVNNKAYDYCMKNKNSSSYIFITDSFDAYWYCVNVKDRPEVRKFITVIDLKNYNKWKNSQ